MPTPNEIDKLGEMQSAEAKHCLIRFFMDRYELNEKAPDQNAEFSADEFVGAQYRFDAKFDQSKGMAPEPMNEQYPEAIQLYLDVLVQEGFLSRQQDDNYILTQKGQAVLPRIQ